MALVLDASVVLELLLRTALGQRAEREIFAHAQRSAPHLLDIEVAHALRRMVLAGGLDAGDGEAALAALSAFRLDRLPHLNLLPRIWELRDSIAAYDACYVALAEALGAPLLTCDAKLARAHGHRAEIRLLR